MVTIRLFVSAWARTETADGSEVTNPVQGAVDASGAMVRVVNFYPPSGADGLPLAPWCMTVIRADDHAAWTGLPGVTEWDRYALDTPLSAVDMVPVLAKIESFGIPAALYNGAQTWLDVIARTIHVFEPTFSTLGSDDPAEYA